MVDDPYKVLGVSRDADKETIKKAYRQKAKQYHPDLHPDDPVAAQKMNEVNEAYDMLNNPEKYRQQTGSGYGGQTYRSPYGSAYGGYYQGNSQRSQSQGGGFYGGYYGGGFGSYDFDDFFGFGGYQRSAEIPKPTPEPGDLGTIRQTIDFINMGQYSYAAQTLNSMVSVQRNDRWYYLSAIVNYKMGQRALALEQIQRAVQMAPNKAVYQQTMQAMRQSGTTYQQTGRVYQSYTDGMSKMCTRLCWLHCLLTFCCRC